MCTQRLHLVGKSILLVVTMIAIAPEWKALASDCVKVFPCDVTTGDCNKPFCDNVVPPTENPVPPPDEEPPGATCGDGAIGVGGLPWNGMAIHPDSCGTCGGGNGKGDPGYWDGLGSSGGMTTFPVNYAYGYKQFTTTDLKVALPGRDFVLSRSYISKLGLPDHWFGRNWQLNCAIFIQRDTLTGSDDKVLSVTSLAAGTTRFVYDAGLSRWLPPGTTHQFIETTTLTIDIGEGSNTYPVYKLTEPGSWVLYFGRFAASSLIDQNTWKDGIIFRMEDWYGNQKNFKYVDIDSGPSAEKWRLGEIACVPSGGNSNDGAKIAFDWYSTTHSTNALRGALQQVRAQRFTFNSGAAPQWAWRDVQKVEYIYKTGSDDHLGSTRDLVQVTKSTLIDFGQWYVTIEQFRYHTGTTELADDDNDGFLEGGGAHQMKAVFSPEQIEYAAEQYNAPLSDGSKITLSAYADYLRTLPDGASAYGTTKVMALASRVIAKYDMFNTLIPVQEQYVQSACACNGVSQGVRYTYSMLTHASGAYASSMKVVEASYNSGTSTWDTRRTHYFDLIKSTVGINSVPTDMYYLGIRAIQDQSSNEWVTRYSYDGNRRLYEVFVPSAHSNYTPGTNGGASASYTTNSNGLVHRTEYNADNRVNRRSVRKVSDSSATTIEELTYDTPNPFLVTQIDRFRIPTPSSGDDKETTTFAYQYHSPGKVSWIETAVEAELETENGPAGTNMKYYSHEYFNAVGLNTWSRSEDGKLTKRTFGDDDPTNTTTDTGNVTAVAENTTNSGIPSTAGLNGDFSGRNGDGGSLTTSFDYDDLGMLRSMTSPSGKVTRYVRELARNERQPYERKGFTRVNPPFIEPYLVTVVLPHTFTENSTTKFDGPAQVTIIDAGGKPFEATINGLTADASSKYGDIFGSGYDFILSTTPLSRSTTQHHLTGLVQSTKAWHSVSNTADPPGYYTTSYAYDNIGHVAAVTAPNSTVTKYTYDILDRPIATQIGTADANMVIVSEAFYDSGGSATQGVGDGNVTLQRQQLNGGNRDTKYTYDYRNRLTTIEPPEKPNTYRVYDNLDRVVEEAVFDDTVNTDLTVANTHRGRYVATSFSQRGLPYKRIVAIDPTLASASRTYLDTNSWFDEAGRQVGAWPFSGPGTKTTYDGLGRTTATYTTDRGGDAAPGAAGNYAHVFTNHAAVLTNDVVIEQMNYRYIANDGLMDLATTYRRGHRAINHTPPLINDIDDTGPLSGFAVSKRIVTYMGYLYDDAERVRYTVNYGTNTTGGFVGIDSPPTVTQGTPPAPTAPELVTETSYNDRGLVDLSTDPSGHKTKYFYDDLSRQIGVAENYDNAVLSWNTAPLPNHPARWAASGLDANALDVDRLTSFVYDGVGIVTQQVAHVPKSGGGEDVQVTQYVYGVTKGAGATDSDIQSNDLLFQVHYPDEGNGEANSTADFTVTYAYNRQGELRYMKDQSATVHNYTRDNVGRVTVDITGGTGNATLDATVTAIGTAYDSFGRTQLVRSYSAYNSSLPDNGVLNAVKFTYTNLWQVKDVWQEPTGNVVESGTPSLKVTYGYTDQPRSGSTGNYSRLTSLIYPDTNVVPYQYGAASGNSDDRISRLTRINISSHNIDYDFIGVDMVAAVDFAAPDVQLDRTATHLGERDVAGGYPGFDRFGRDQRLMWVDGNFTSVGTPPTRTNRPPVVELTYTYDKSSNRLTTYNENVALGSWAIRDNVYSYDNLDRLKQADRGKTGTPFVYAANNGFYTPSQAWATPTGGQSLDMLGNWRVLVTDLDTNGPNNGTDNKECRTHNSANELSAQDSDCNGTAGLTHTYDKVGNMRTQSVGPEASPSTVTYTHDFWNRLVKVEYGGDVRAVYAYNGLNWRITKQADTDASGGGTGGLDQERRMFYSANWQLLEERIDDEAPFSGGSDIDRHMQYIWGIRYIDDLAIRRLDANHNGSYSDTGDKIYYHCNDSQFSAVTVLDGTNAKTLERISYDAYGKARHHQPEDMNGDGTVNTGDQLVVNNNWGSVPAPGDINRDGLVNSSDLLAVTNNWASGIASGKLSITDNQVGWDAYVYNQELDGGGLYTVRNRTYRTELGRWLQRDPKGLEVNPYLYCTASPLVCTDSAGLQGEVEPIETSPRVRNPFRLLGRTAPNRNRPGGGTPAENPPDWPEPWPYENPVWPEDPGYIPPELRPPPGTREVPQFADPFGPPAPRLIQPINPQPQPTTTNPIVPLPTIPAPDTPEYKQLPYKLVVKLNNRPSICTFLDAQKDAVCNAPRSCKKIELRYPAPEELCQDLERRRDRNALCCFYRRQRWYNNCHPHDQTHAEQIYNACEKTYRPCMEKAELCRQLCGPFVGPVTIPPN